MRIWLLAIISAASFTGAVQANENEVLADWSGWWGGVSVGATGLQYGTAGTFSDDFCVARPGPVTPVSCVVTGNGYAIERSYDPNLNFFWSGVLYSDPLIPAQLEGLSRFDVIGRDPVIDYGAMRISAPLGFDLPGQLDQAIISGSAYLRHDWQVGAFVMGVEGDISKLIGPAVVSMSSDDIAVMGVTAKAAQSMTLDLGAIASIRARAGFATGNMLSYVFGGVVTAHVTGHQSKNIKGNVGPSNIDFSSFESVSSQVFAPVIGAGVGYMIADNISIGGESAYQFFDESFSFSDGQSIDLTGAWSASVRRSFRFN